MQSKSQQQYFNKCLTEASKSPMCYKLGAVLVKGGKILSSGFNHTKTGYAGPGATNKCRGFVTPASFHAEMHALFTALGGVSPSFKAQVTSKEYLLADPGGNNSKGRHRLKHLKTKKLHHRRSKNSANIKDSTAIDSDNSSGHGLGGAELSPTPSISSSFSSSSSDHYTPPSPPLKPILIPQNRYRHPRVNGSDLYVVRAIKDGTGKAFPCNRCIEWCRWAGVKRIFHWDPDVNGFVAVKVNEETGYETLADLKMFAGSFQ